MVAVWRSIKEETCTLRCEGPWAAWRLEVQLHQPVQNAATRVLYSGIAKNRVQFFTAEACRAASTHPRLAPLEVQMSFRKQRGDCHAKSAAVHRGNRHCKRHEALRTHRVE